MLTIEPGLLAPWMAAQHKEAFDISLPFSILESLQGAIIAGVINTDGNTRKDGKPVIEIVVDETLNGYLSSVGIDPGGLQFFVMRQSGGVSDSRRLPMQFLIALCAGVGRNITNYQQWKSQVVAKGWHMDKPFYRELLNVLNEEIALLAVVKPVEAGKGDRYSEWQSRVDAEYQKNTQQSHSAICMRLYKELGTSHGNLVRRTDNPRNKTK